MKTNKLTQLREKIREYKSLAIAFSGGVDSSFLAVIAKEELGTNCIAITAYSPYIPNWEMKEAIQFTQKHNIQHEIVKLDIPSEIKHNPANRCYLCKHKIFAELIRIATEHGINTIADGSNADDVSDYRPGMQALKELKVVSPLMEIGITKTEIRQYSKAL
jgi:uncharacterized protein